MPTERIDWLDVAKGGSILLVVCLHATMYLSEVGLASYGFTALNTLFEPIRMPVFFTVSGVLAARAIQSDWTTLFQRRIWIFVSLFGLWTLIRWLYYRTIQINTVAPFEGSSYAELLTSWVAPSSGLWFIWALGLYFVAAKALSPIRSAGLAVALALSVVVFGGLIQPENFAQRNLMLYAPFFLTGAWHGQMIVRQVGRSPLRACLIGVAGFAALQVAAGSLPPPLVGSGRLMLCVFGVLLGTASAVLIARVAPLRAGFGYLGRNTLPIYVAHVLIVSLLSAAISEYLSALPLVRYWSVPLLIITTIPLSLGLRTLADRVGAGWLYQPPPLVLPNLRFAREL